MSTDLAPSYDVVIIGGAMMGSSLAWHLSQSPDFEGRILVVERDLTYAACSTAHTNSCIRQQFSYPLNVEMSRYTAQVLRDLSQIFGADAPQVKIRNFGYLYLTATEAGRAHHQQIGAMQRRLGAGTEWLEPGEIAARYPFYDLEGIIGGSLNTVDEGYWDGHALFDLWRKGARAAGVTYVEDEVVAVLRAGQRVHGVRLASGARIAAGAVVNAAGPRAARVAAMAGIPDLPVEPRKRLSWIFRASQPLDRPLPLTIDPSGLHVRDHGGGTYLAGGRDLDLPDGPCDPRDFSVDHGLWERAIWPALAARIPAFEALRLEAEWAGHYAYNPFDQNAIIGPHPEVAGFFFLNGFSGHGLQHSPAMGRGLAEWITLGRYDSLDLSPFAFARIAENRPVPEIAVI